MLANNWGYPQIRAQNPSTPPFSDHSDDRNPNRQKSPLLVVYPLTTNLIRSTLLVMTTRPADKKLFTGTTTLTDPWGSMYRSDPVILKSLDYLSSRSATDLDSLNQRTYAILYPSRAGA
jgi:hypothetical protein